MRKLLPLLLILLLLAGCTVQPPETTTPTAAEEDHLAVHFIDVGQADCALLECGGKYMLIDGGNTADGPAVRQYLTFMGVDKLELMVATHPHEDHIGGLATVLDYFETETVWTTEITYSNYTVRNFLETADRQDVPVKEELSAGELSRLFREKLRPCGKAERIVCALQKRLTPRRRNVLHRCAVVTADGETDRAFRLLFSDVTPEGIFRRLMTLSILEARI